MKAVIHLDVLDNASIYGPLEAVIHITDFSSAIIAGTLAGVVGCCQLLLDGLIHGRQKDDLAVSGLGHGLHCLEVADLHSRGRRKDIGSLEMI